MNQVALIWVLAEKDLRVEYRSPQAFLNTVFFAVLILVIFNFAFDPGSQATREATPGILWVALLFPGIIQLNRSFQAEREEGTLYGLILSPTDRGVLYLGKFLANWAFLVVVDFFVLVAFVIFYNFSFYKERHLHFFYTKHFFFAWGNNQFESTLKMSPIFKNFSSL